VAEFLFSDKSASTIFASVNISTPLLVNKPLYRVEISLSSLERIRPSRSIKVTATPKVFKNVETPPPFSPSYNSHALREVCQMSASSLPMTLCPSFLRGGTSAGTAPEAIRIRFDSNRLRIFPSFLIETVLGFTKKPPLE